MINNIKLVLFGNKGFSKLLMVIVVFVLAVFITSCSGNETNKVQSSEKIVKTESSETTPGMVTQTTCLECHPAIESGDFYVEHSNPQKNDKTGVPGAMPSSKKEKGKSKKIEL